MILGGCGFIGRHVAALLARAGDRVVLADRAPPGFAFLPELRDLISWERLALSSADWDRLVDGADVVHHYAWSSIPASANHDPVGDLMENVAPTLALLDAVRRRGDGGPRVVFASSGGTVYGRLREVPAPEDHPLRPISAYGAGKVTAETYLARIIHQV